MGLRPKARCPLLCPVRAPGSHRLSDLPPAPLSQRAASEHPGAACAGRKSQRPPTSPQEHVFPQACCLWPLSLGTVDRAVPRGSQPGVWGQGGAGSSGCWSAALGEPPSLSRPRGPCSLGPSLRLRAGTVGVRPGHAHAAPRVAVLLWGPPAALLTGAVSPHAQPAFRRHAGLGSHALCAHDRADDLHRNPRPDSTPLDPAALVSERRHLVHPARFHGDPDKQPPLQHEHRVGVQLLHTDQVLLCERDRRVLCPRYRAPHRGSRASRAGGPGVRCRG